MPKFSQASFSKLSTCEMDLQVLFFEVIKHRDCTILKGYRNESEQEDAFSSGHSKLHYPHSKHNHQPSLAVDCCPYPVDLSNEKLAIWFAGMVMGIAAKLKEEGKMKYSIRWGGNWTCNGMLNTPGQLSDLNHFELIV